MHIQSLKTKIITPGSSTLIELVDAQALSLPEDSVVAVSSKIVSLCEGSVVKNDGTRKDALITQQSQQYIAREENKYGAMVTIVKNSLMLAAGIDESNADGNYVLWPKDPLATAKQLHEFLRKKFNVKSVGVIIVDSTSRPLRIGTIGTSIAHFGFSELNDYRGTNDLFGKEMVVSQANVAESLASAAVLAMGEGAEQTPLAIVTEVPFIKFDASIGGSCYDSSNALLDDVYYPALKNANWRTH